ncbi:uncharacterized protein Nmag_0532 [Natrialba magadii ATCC 43099]|uniref:Uncharacterized protein n=1 Tax=Natrialba magadii (strain ATCC 43099 / DSM 3394 / CCM 3739 / CIP 104546 / IAM 13178 / JCM 8861 / NBRC 102185 / NCIMB 2190 / MS3) TaxID=547559 RepID=D3SYK8_NATMM|nr:hypothetical protein [Natrialba magadii]ADD04119.1 uncharacterized protein Nmag_0532 [Natrialba magadii ATCC 43099]ELY33274.1 hypothetical protein C500_03059 [Natrialba magadii ATCC 43099]
METQRPTLREDLGRAREESAVHLWGAIGSAIVSMFIPILGLITAYSGYKLTDVMSRRWFGLLFAAFGLANVISWILWLAMLAGYI